MFMKEHQPSTASLELSIIIPLLNEESNVDVVTKAVVDEIDKLDIAYEVILVDDGSTDNTWIRILELSIRYPTIKGVSLSRNFGPQHAMFSGYHFSSGSAVVTMDGDMQHPPETIAKMLEAWRNGYKVIETQRIDSDDFSYLKRLSSSIFNRLFSYLSGLSMPRGTSDFRLLDKSVVDIIKQMRDSELFLRGITHWVGFRRTTVTYEANNRFSGTTKFGMLRLLKYSMGALLSFSLKPLRIGLWLGIAMSFLAFGELIYILVRYWQGATVPGWASTLTVISLMFGVLFVLLGIIGAYIGSIFEMLKGRPRFIPSDTIGFDENSNKK